MTNAVKTQTRRGKGIRRLAAAAAVFGLAITGVAAVGVPAFAAPARPAAAAEAYVPTAVEPAAREPIVTPATPSERGVPGPALSIFFGTALTVGAGGVVTARLLAHRQHKLEEARITS
jgi:hypothetical protein